MEKLPEEGCDDGAALWQGVRSKQMTMKKNIQGQQQAWSVVPAAARSLKDCHRED